jgi:hypothetical protein
MIHSIMVAGDQSDFKYLGCFANITRCDVGCRCPALLLLLGRCRHMLHGLLHEPTWQ